MHGPDYFDSLRRDSMLNTFFVVWLIAVAVFIVVPLPLQAPSPVMRELIREVLIAGLTDASGMACSRRRARPGEFLRYWPCSD